MTHVNVLSLASAMYVSGRAGSLARHAYQRHPKRAYLDLIIDGKPLIELLHESGHQVWRGYISPFGWEDDETEVGKRKAGYLLGQSHEAGIWKNRCSLLVCGECGEPACGTVTAEVIMDSRFVYWREFSFENHDTDPRDMCWFKNMGPLVFERSEYETLLGAQ